MKKVLMLIGISGSGKSTFARQFCTEHPNWLRVNRDDLRRSLVSVSLSDYYTWPEWQRNRVETVVNELQKTVILESLNRGWHVVIDNTNLKLSYIHQFRRLLTGHFDKVDIQYVVFDTPIDECIRRDQERSDSVGEAVIRRQAEQLTIMKKNVRFHKETLTRNPVFQREQDEKLPRCILVDIDGTVASMGDPISGGRTHSGRSPFDWHRVGEDSPKWPVINLVKAMRMSNYRIVFLSGRDAVSRPHTIAWLNEHFGWQESDYDLFMRSEKDNRKDSIIKHELFENHIQGRYYVEFVVDDRQQVVDMWRRTVGLTCLQVDYGDF